MLRFPLPTARARGFILLAVRSLDLMINSSLEDRENDNLTFVVWYLLIPASDVRQCNHHGPIARMAPQLITYIGVAGRFERPSVVSWQITS